MDLLILPRRKQSAASCFKSKAHMAVRGLKPETICKGAGSLSYLALICISACSSLLLLHLSIIFLFILLATLNPPVCTSLSGLILSFHGFFFSGPRKDFPCSSSSVEAPAKMSILICDLETRNICLATANHWCN